MVYCRMGLVFLWFRGNVVVISFVRIQVVHPTEMRYRTVGDWYFCKDSGALNIKVADTGNWKYNILVAVHELIEVILCKNDGVTEKAVDRLVVGQFEHLCATFVILFA